MYCRDEFDEIRFLTSTSTILLKQLGVIRRYLMFIMFAFVNLQTLQGRS